MKYKTINSNILIFADEFPPEGGGAGVVAYQNAKALNALGYNVTILTRYNKRQDLNLDGIKVIPVKMIKQLWFIFYFFKLIKFDFKFYDYILLNDINAIYMSGLCFNKKNFLKTFCYLQGSEPRLVYNQSSFKFKLILFKFFYNRSILKSKKIIAVSQYMKDKFINETPFKNKNKILVNYAGLSEEFSKDKKINNTRFMKYKKQNILLTVSRIEKQKGFLDMYKIFKKLHLENESEFIWLVVGDGSYRKEFENLVKKEHFDKYIIFEGKTNRDELYNYYKRADVFWLLSNLQESFGLVYLEAQAFGCPAIGRNLYGVKESIVNKKSGFLVNSNEECFNLLHKKDYTKLNKNDIKKNALNFTSKSSGKNLMRIFKEFK